MWRSPSEFPGYADVLTRNPRSRVAMDRMRQREERLRKEQAHRAKLRRMAARGLLPTQIDAATGLALGHAFKVQREEEAVSRRAAARERKAAAKAGRGRLGGAGAAGGRATTAPEGARRSARRSHHWDAAAAERPKTAEEKRAERVTAIQNITARNDRIKAELRAQSADSLRRSPLASARVRRDTSAPPLSYEALAASSDHFPMSNASGGVFDFGDTDSDGDTDSTLPGLEEREMARPVTAPLPESPTHRASHMYNYLDELANRPLSDSGVRRRAQAERHDPDEERPRPSTPYLDSVAAERANTPSSAYRSRPNSRGEMTMPSGEWSEVGEFSSLGLEAGEDEGSEVGMEDSAEGIQQHEIGSFYTSPPTVDDMFRLSGAPRPELSPMP